MPAASGSAVDRRLEQRVSSLDRTHEVRAHTPPDPFPCLPSSLEAAPLLLASLGAVSPPPSALEYLDPTSAVIDR